MKLKDLNLGNLDAKNELLTNSEVEKENFIRSYVIPPSLNIDLFLEGKRYFITGLKGTGKTALLRYISIQQEKSNPNLHSYFILFKSEINDFERKSLATKSSSNNFFLPQESIDTPPDENYISSWLYFLYEKIVHIQKHKEKNIFQRNGNWERFVKLVEAPNKKSSSAFIPKLKHSKINISMDPSIQAELEWDNSGSVNFEAYIKALNKSFEALEADTDSLSLFFDELELNFTAKKQRERDIKLIRDLILTIERFNSKAKRLGFNITIYSAIRTEVKNSIHSSGYEINKSLSDFGVGIIWHKPGITDEKQPILEVIIKRLQHQLKEYIPDEQIWKNWFPEKIQNEKTKKYILHNSWYRPRDVIRLLKLAQDENPESESFTHEIFDSIRQKYSEDSWIELREELTAKYQNKDISAIERIFEGFKKSFSLEEFYTHVTETKELYSYEGDINDDSQHLRKLLADLYDIGFLGNVVWDNSKGHIFKFSYRGDLKINLRDNFYIHPSLKKHFNIN